MSNIIGVKREKLSACEQCEDCEYNNVCKCNDEISDEINDNSDKLSDEISDEISDNSDNHINIYTDYSDNIIKLITRLKKGPDNIQKDNLNTECDRLIELMSTTSYEKIVVKDNIVTAMNYIDKNNNNYQSYNLCCNSDSLEDGEYIRFIMLKNNFVNFK